MKTDAETRNLENKGPRKSQAQPRAESRNLENKELRKSQAQHSSEIPKFLSSGIPQQKIATASFCAAVAFSVAGFVVPPLGDLTEANLYLVAQFLLVTTSIFGVGAMATKFLTTKKKEPDENEKDQ